MMGLQEISFWVAWFVAEGAFALLPSIAMSLIVVFGGVLNGANVLAVFLTLYLYALSMIAWSFMITAFFNAAKPAGVSGLLAILPLLPFFPLLSATDVTSPALFYMASLLSPTAVGLVMNEALHLQSIGSGLTLARLGTATRYSVLSCPHSSHLCAWGLCLAIQPGQAALRTHTFVAYQTCRFVCGVL